MLDIVNVHKSFNIGTPVQKDALTGLNLHLEKGDFVTVIGGNGAGKSTMLNAVAGVFGVEKGSIRIDGHDVTKDPEYKRAKYIGRVFQDPLKGTAGDMWIEENLALALRRGKRRSFRWGISNKEREMFVELLKITGFRARVPLKCQGRPAVRRTAPGADAAHGDDSGTEAAAFR